MNHYDRSPVRIMLNIVVFTFMLVILIDTIFSYVNHRSNWVMDLGKNMVKLMGIDSNLPTEQTKETAKATAQATSQATAEAVQTAPAVVTPTVPAPEFPWSMVLGVLFSIVIGIVAIIAVVFCVRKFIAAKRNRTDVRLAWEKLIARHDSVRKSWASYELDIAKIIRSPLMSDMRNPLTVNLHAALRDADDSRPSDIANVLHKDVKGSTYEVAVIELEKAYQQAVAESYRVKWNNYSNDEKKRLRKAQDLLNLAMNDRATEFERQAAYKALRKELDGLLVIPEKATVAIETKMHLMIEASTT